MVVVVVAAAVPAARAARAAEAAAAAVTVITLSSRRSVVVVVVGVTVDIHVEIVIMALAIVVVAVAVVSATATAVLGLGPLSAMRAAVPMLCIAEDAMAQTLGGLRKKGEAVRYYFHSVCRIAEACPCHCWRGFRSLDHHTDEPASAATAAVDGGHPTPPKGCSKESLLYKRSCTEASTSLPSRAGAQDYDYRKKLGRL